MQTIPIANPSNPSIQLIAFIIPTIQSTVKERLNKLIKDIDRGTPIKVWISRIFIWKPIAQNIIDSTIWKNNLTKGDKLNKSSKKPIIKKHGAIPKTGQKKLFCGKFIKPKANNKIIGRYNPIKIPKQPVPEFTLPRVLQDYDFGPQPLKGAIMWPSAASAQVWGTTISSIAGTVGGMFANNTKSITNIYNNS